MQSTEDWIPEQSNQSVSKYTQARNRKTKFCTLEAGGKHNWRAGSV